MQVERGKTHTEISSINTDEGNGKINTRGRCQKPEIDALEFVDASGAKNQEWRVA